MLGFENEIKNATTAANDNNNNNQIRGLIQGLEDHFASIFIHIYPTFVMRKLLISSILSVQATLP